MLASVDRDALLIRALREHGERYVSGEELAATLGVTRAAVLKRMRALAARGFAVEGRRGVGYRLVSVPVGVDEAFLKAEVERFGLAGCAVVVLDVVESTQDLGVAMVQTLATPALVVASEQRAGRGRFRRSWLSPAGGLWMSVAIPFAASAVDPGAVSLGSAVAVAQALEAVGVEARIKWPNDIFLGDRKLGGILVNAVSEEGRVVGLVVGVGLNVNVPAHALGPLEGRATSVLVETGAETPLCPLAADVARRLVPAVTVTGRREVIAEARQRLWGVGRRVAVRFPDGREVGGTIVGLADDFGLLLETGRGVEAIPTGEVVA